MERSSHLATLFRLDRKVAVVTGAASGLGREIAAAFADAGAEVVGLDRARPDPADEVRFVEVDVVDPAAVAAAFVELDRVDVLVNAAGIGGWGTTTEYPDELWQRVLDVNLSGTFFCCREAGRKMVAAGSGSRLDVASDRRPGGFAGGGGVR